MEYTSHQYIGCLQCKSMSLQIVLQSEWLITHIRGIWVSLYVDVSSNDPATRIIYYIHHRSTVTLQYICVNVCSDYLLNELFITNITHISKPSNMYTMRPSQILLDSEWLITHITGVWILSTMYVMMSALTTLLPKCFATHTTGVQLLPKMYMLMYIHSSPVCEWFTAHITSVWMFSTTSALCIFRWYSTLNDLQHTSQAYGHSPLCMCWCIFEITLLRERLITHVTGIQVLSTTCTSLSLHKTTLPECCITHVTGFWIIHIRYVLILIPSTVEEEERKKRCGRWRPD